MKAVEQSPDAGELVWPWAPAADLPQMIVFLIVDDDERIQGVFWAEAMGWICIRRPGSLGHAQMETMIRWLADWLEQEAGLFAPSGRKEVERMLKSLRHCIARRETLETAVAVF